MSFDDENYKEVLEDIKQVAIIRQIGLIYKEVSQKTGVAEFSIDDSRLRLTPYTVRLDEESEYDEDVAKMLCEKPLCEYVNWDALREIIMRSFALSTPILSLSFYVLPKNGSELDFSSVEIPGFDKKAPSLVEQIYESTFLPCKIQVSFGKMRQKNLNTSFYSNYGTFD